MPLPKSRPAHQDRESVHSSISTVRWSTASPQRFTSAIESGAGKSGSVSSSACSTPLCDSDSAALRGESLIDLDELGERLFTERVASRLYSHMREIVQAHQERGHTVVMSSSALSIQALPVARFLGISNVQCNRFELDEHGCLTGGIVKPIVWGTTKAAAVQQFCADNDVAVQRSYFYADGDEDAASMSVVGYPRPVNPRSGLAAEAAAHGWPVMCLASVRRRPMRTLRYLANHVRREAHRDAD
jgi:HAD superfamily hydrolase (TIGR01490 family)